MANTSNDCSDILASWEQSIDENNKNVASSNSEDLINVGRIFESQQFSNLSQSNEITELSMPDMSSLTEYLNNDSITLSSNGIPEIEKNLQKFIYVPNINSQDSSDSPERTQPSMNLSSPDGIDVVVSNQPNQYFLIEPSSQLSSDDYGCVVQNSPQISCNLTESESGDESQSDRMDISRIIPSLFQTVKGDSKKLKCSKCSFTADASNEPEFEKHLEKHRNELTNMVFETAKKLNFEKKPRKSKLRKNKSNVSGTEHVPEVNKGPFICQICSKEFPMISVYKRHLKEHKDEKAHKCNQCPDSFDIAANLTLHKAVHAKPGPDGYECPACQRHFARIAGFKSHLSVHMEDETMMCAECGDEFRLKSELDKHMAQHLQEMEIHLADKVGKTFPKYTSFQSQDNGTISKRVIYSSSSRRRGRRKKADPKKCPLCNKVFQKDSQFQRHYRIHTGEKPFTCGQCDRAFNQKSALVTHSNSKHNGQKPFKCPHCPQTYSQRGNLQTHMNRVHCKFQDNQFHCIECSCTFKRVGSLSAHMTKYHPDIENSNSQIQFQHPQQETSLNVGLSSSPNPKVSIENEEAPQVEDNSESNLPSEFHQESFLSMLTSTETNEAQTYINSESCGRNFLSKTADMEELTASSSAEEMQTLFQSLETSFDSQVTGNDLEVVNGSLLTGDVDEDIVRRALQNSGLKTCADTVLPVLKPENIARTIESVSASYHLQNTSPVSQVSPQNNNTPVEFNREESISQNKNEMNFVEANTSESAPDKQIPRKNVVSGVYFRTAKHTWKVRKVGGVRWHQCMYCPKEFKKPSDLERHIRTHTMERPFKCLVCSKSFTVKTSLTTHMRTHTGLKAHKCPICFKSLSTASSLKIHLRIHTNSRPFKCNICDLSFRTTSHRKGHLAAHTRGTAHKNTRKCKDLSTIQPTTIQSTTIQPATSLTTFLYSDQQQTVPQPPKLQRPILIMNRTGEEVNHIQTMKDNTSETDRPHKCEICKKAFKKSCHLLQHIKAHTGEHPYKCTQCQKSFRTSSALRAHVNTHTGRRAFRCHICNQTFSANHTLKRHMTKHSEERPYMCPYCRRTYKTNGSCQKHISARHKNEKIPVVGNTVEVGGVEDEDLTTMHVFHDSNDYVNGDNEIDQITGDQNQLLQQFENIQASKGLVSPNEIVHPHGVAVDPNTISVDYNSAETLTQIDLNLISNMNHLESSDTSYFNHTPVRLLQNVTDDDVAIVTSSADDNRSSNEWKQDNNQEGIFVQQIEEFFKCQGCEQIYDTKQLLQWHIEQEEQNNPGRYGCQFCCHTFQNELSLFSHQRAHQSIKQGQAVHTCPVCFVYFDKEELAEEHRQSHYPSSEHTCSTCSLQFTSLEQLQEHIKNEHPNPIKKKISKRKRTGFYVLSEEQHKLLSKTTPSQEMSVSERVLLSAVAEKGTVSHPLKPGTRGRYKEFETNGPLHRHVCKHCPKSFQKPSDLERHLRTHTGSKPFSCPTCGKSFRLKSTLKCHQKSHSKEKAFRCHICNINYATKSTLKVHMRLHTGAKPYSCSHCQMKFRTPGNRKAHMITHMVQPDSSSTSLSTPSTSNDAQIDDLNANQTIPETNIRSSESSTINNPAQCVTSPTPSSNQPLVLPNSTFIIPMEELLKSGILQQDSNSSVRLPIQLNGENMQITSDNPNIQIQIDPVVLQQTLQESQQLNQRSDADTITSSSPTTSSSRLTFTAPPNVIIQPLCVQQQTSNSTLESCDQSNEVQHQMHEYNIAVPSSLAGITQQLFQSPLIFTSPSITDESGKTQEFPLTENVVIQAVHQLLENFQPSENGSQTFRLQNVQSNQLIPENSQIKVTPSSGGDGGVYVNDVDEANLNFIVTSADQSAADLITNSNHGILTYSNSLTSNQMSNNSDSNFASLQTASTGFVEDIFDNNVTQTHRSMSYEGATSSVSTNKSIF